MEESQIRRRTEETITVFMPIAKMLGNEKLIKELNALSVRSRRLSFKGEIK